MDLLVHVIDPIDRDEMMPAAGFRIVLAQYDAVGSLQVVDGTNVLAVQAHNFHVLLNVQTFEYVASPLITNVNAQRGKRFLTLLDQGAKLQNHTTLRLSDGPVWWLKFHDDPRGTNLGIGGQDRTVRVFNMNRFKTLFSNPEMLEKEAEAQGGLIIGDVSGQPQIVSVPEDEFKAKQRDPDLQAAAFF
jgi:hypothetical protein